MAAPERSIAERILGPVPELPRPEALGADRRASVILWSVAALLVLLIFRAGFDTPGDLNDAWSSWGHRDFAGRIYWASWGFLFYLAAPLAIVRFVFRESPARYGFRFYLTRRTALLYAGLVLFMIPFLYWASAQPGFLRRYPFIDYDGGAPPIIIIWEIVYLSRFVALEFFFRGYMLFGLEEKLGTWNAVAATVIPYAVMHFAKPFPEAVGSILAGAALGYIALRTRTIIGGVIMHSSVALIMDLLALWKKGALF